jgi:hypothetical protein
MLDVFATPTDRPYGVRALAGIGGCLTLAMTAIAIALAGAALALRAHRLARTLLVVVAVGGFSAALLLWLPAAIALGAAVSLLPDGRTAGR